ncbi:MAG TPA: glycosyl transferase family 1 [Desulfobulbaceae bacterium]|nr:glycosyl transferase family 1 [Desulfobulbaceae bacterium]
MTADPIGGVWSYAIELCRNLQHYDVPIALATMGRELSVDQHRAVERLPHVRLFESRYRLCWMEDPWDDVARAGDWLLALADQFRPDVVHLNDLAHGGLTWQVPVLVSGHSCVLSWWQAVHGEPAPATWRQYRTVAQKSVQRADLVVAPSPAMLTALRHHYGPARDARVVANGRDFPPVVSPGAKAARTESLVLAAGRIWDKAKNIAMLAAIAGQLDWPVFVAGEAGNSENGATADAGLHHLGFLDEETLSEWLTRAAIFAAPARYEPFGLSILEAARAGCALVLGDIASLRKIWEDAAVYVNPDRPEELRRALAGLIDDPVRRHQLATRARRRALWFTGSRMATGYLHCYQSLLAKAETGKPAGNDEGGRS